jgi:hypothetical protein
VPSSRMSNPNEFLPRRTRGTSTDTLDTLHHFDFR